MLDITNMPVALTQPKRPCGGGYGVFLTEKRPEFQKACEGLPRKSGFTAVTKMAGDNWKNMTDAQQAPYNKKYADAKVQFDKDMAAFLAKGGEVTKGARGLRSEKRKARDAKKKKDINAPKRPGAGAYSIFLAENRAKIMQSLPAGSRVSDVAKVAGETWKALSDAQRKPYDEKFLKKQEEYKVALAEYKKNLPEDAEEDEEAEDEEEEEEEEEEDEESPLLKKARK